MTDLLGIWIFATPLLLAAFGETIVQRAGMLNIGLEGTMLVGAFVAAATGTVADPHVALLAGGAAGLVLTLIGGVFTIRWEADQVVVGTAVTLLALGVTSTLARASFGGGIHHISAFPEWGRVDAVMILALLTPIALTWLLSNSRWGLRLRACGEYPAAAEAHGARVEAMRWQALAIGGTLGGLAGAYLSIGVAESFAENMVAGRGFVAIAMVTFGRWHPVLVGISCLLIGFLESLQFSLQGRAGVPHQLLLGLPYAAALLVLIVSSRGARAPAALGLPFRSTR